MMCAQFQDVFPVETFGAINVKKVHDGSAVRIVFETQHVTQFVYGGGVDGGAIHFFCRTRIHRNLPAKIYPAGELRAGYHGVIQNVRTTADNPDTASVKARFFMEVDHQHGTPELEGPAKRICPSSIHVDLDANVPKNPAAQIIVLRAWRIGAVPVRGQVFLRLSRYPANATGA